MLTTALVGGGAVAGISYYLSASAKAGASPGERIYTAWYITACGFHNS